MGRTERGRAQRWFGAALLVGGTFTLLYWDLRVLGRLGVIWYPMITW